MVNASSRLLGGQPGVEEHLQQQISQFLPQPVRRVRSPGSQRLDDLDDLVGLLDQVRNEGLVGLLPVPRALAAKGVHHGHRVEQPGAHRVERPDDNLDLDLDLEVVQATAFRPPYDVRGQLGREPRITVVGRDPHDVAATHEPHQLGRGRVRTLEHLEAR